jgi:LysM repeat protein
VPSRAIPQLFLRRDCQVSLAPLRALRYSVRTQCPFTVAEKGETVTMGLVERYVERERWRRRLQLEMAPAQDPEPLVRFGRSALPRARGGRRRWLAGLGVIAALAAERADATTLHVVQPGETLSQIAARYGVSVPDLARANELSNPDRILVGAVLRIPASLLVSERVHRVRPGETLTSIAQRYGVSVESIRQANRLPDPDRILVGQMLVIPSVPETAMDTSASSSARRYVVQPGDTLSALAVRFGVPLSTLVKANGISDPDRLLAGQTLVIPRRELGAGVLLAGVPAYRQSLPLSCESAAVSMVTAYWGKPVSEWVFIENLPSHPNPHRGFRGNMSGTFGGTDDYGVYAEPFIPILERYGFRAQAVYARGDVSVLREELSLGRPVVVWMTNLASVQPRLIGEADGERFILVPQEHAVVVYGYDEERVYVVDPGDGQYRSFGWDDFLRSWGYFDSMMLRILPAPWG